MVKCVIYDRDGILNALVKREKQETAPWSFKEFSISKYAKQVTLLTKTLGYMNIVVSNQPDLNDGLLSKQDLDQINDSINRHLSVDVIAYALDRKSSFYKPKNGLVELLINTYNIDRANSFFIGDRWKDIVCGNESNLHTIFVGEKYDCPETHSHSLPKFCVENVMHAGLIIKKLEEHND
jgi:D-glycero-D-manno-heptose 1,7-bisphosphate phosphatase